MSLFLGGVIKRSEQKLVSRQVRLSLYNAMGKLENNFSRNLLEKNIFENHKFFARSLALLAQT